MVRLLSESTLSPTANPSLVPGSRLPVGTFLSSPSSPSLVIALPQYLLFFLILCLLAITALTRISYLVKIGLVSGLTAGQAVLLYLRLTPSFRLYTTFNGLLSNLDIRHYYLAILLTVLVALIIIIRQVDTCSSLLCTVLSVFQPQLTHFFIFFPYPPTLVQFELMSRRLFLWQREVVEQREKVSDIRRKNEALVYNILPPHVAVHFLGKRKSDEASSVEWSESVLMFICTFANTLIHQ